MSFTPHSSGKYPGNSGPVPIVDCDVRPQSNQTNKISQQQRGRPKPTHAGIWPFKYYEGLCQRSIESDQAEHLTYEHGIWLTSKECELRTIAN